MQTPVGAGHEVVQVHACHLLFLREATEPTDASSWTQAEPSTESAGRDLLPAVLPEPGAGAGQWKAALVEGEDWQGD